MSDITFVTVESQTIQNELIQQFETALGITLYPGDERRIFLMQILPLVVGVVDMDKVAKFGTLTLNYGGLI